jgi:hypothetical protein
MTSLVVDHEEDCMIGLFPVSDSGFVDNMSAEECCMASRFKGLVVPRGEDATPVRVGPRKDEVKSVFPGGGFGVVVIPSNGLDLQLQRKNSDLHHGEKMWSDGAERRCGTVE